MKGIVDDATENPLTLPDVPGMRGKWTPIEGVDDKQLQEVWQTLEAQQELQHLKATSQIPDALARFAKDQALQVDDVSITPSQVTLQFVQPDGRPVTGARVRLAAATEDEGEIEALHTRTQALSSDGSAVLKLPTEWHARHIKALQLVLIGGNGTQAITIPLPRGTADGDLLPATVREQVEPLSLGVLAKLADLAAGGDREDVEHAVPVKPEVALGEGDCGMVFRSDPSQDRFSYSLMFRLTDPALSRKTLARLSHLHREGGQLQPVYPGIPVSGRDPLFAVDRVAIDRPISTESFRRAISGVGAVSTTPLAATLAIGYVVTLAQRWTQNGLALGDLVYSLPLAPGEQQRIAVVERTETASVMEREALEQREDMRFDQADSSSVQATFAAGFSESAQGGSEYSANSSSFSVAAAAGGGGVFPFGAFAGGVATSYGQARANGSTSTWMSGARQSTSNAAQNTQASVSRRASAVRSASRASMRLATASETTQVTTKVITNHNKTRALTMQYWEVLRLFDVTTVVQDVNLVCLVPLDVVDFLPAGQAATLSTSALNRNQLLSRYAKLLTHADVLQREVPWRLRKGLQALIEFAADPRSDVQGPTGPAITTIVVKVTGGFTAFDQPQVQLLFRNGVRSQTTRLGGSPPSPPTGEHAFSEEIELFDWLRRTRDGALELKANIPLPRSLPLNDVVGAVITNGARRLDYVFAPKGASTAQSFLGANPVELAGLLGKLALDVRVSKSYPAERVERESGDLDVTVSAAPQDVSGGQPPDVIPTSSGTIVPGSGLTVSASRMAALLSYDDLLEIEKTLQWVLRNAVRCSIRVVASLTAEERTMLLERYSVTPPFVDKDGDVQEGVPLLSCVSNKVLGFYGNSIVMPFQIPAVLAEEIGTDTGKLQRALKRFHMEAFDQPVSTIALPTRGVLGEAVLGRCPAAEKIDLTRFWNWKDSPGDEATAIDAIGMPSGSLTAGQTAPNTLGPATPIINNFSTSGTAADSSLAAAIAQRAIDLGKPFDVAALTNAGNLKDVVNKTTDTAESARKDALSAAKEVAIKAMETAAAYKGVKPAAGEKDGAGGKKEEPKTPTPTTPATPAPTPTPAPQPAPSGQVVVPAAAKPAQLQVFFNKRESVMTDTTAEGRSGQNVRVAAFVDAAKAYKATRIVVRGSASPEGTLQFNTELIADRGETLALKLRAALPGVAVDIAAGSIRPGAPSDEYPELRRADADITAP